MTYPVLQIANKIISNTDREHGELISNLKLQKLLYYVQGFNLAVFNEPLFEESIEAWQYGPVVSEMYFHFKEFGKGAISLTDDSIIADLTPEQEELFQDVLNEYGQFSAIRLMDMTHEESPWKNTFSKTPKGIIDNTLLTQYFKTQIIES